MHIHMYTYKLELVEATITDFNGLDRNSVASGCNANVCYAK